MPAEKSGHQGEVDVEQAEEIPDYAIEFLSPKQAIINTGRTHKRVQSDHDISETQRRLNPGPISHEVTQAEENLSVSQIFS